MNWLPALVLFFVELAFALASQKWLVKGSDTRGNIISEEAHKGIAIKIASTLAFLGIVVMPVYFFGILYGLVFLIFSYLVAQLVSNVIYLVLWRRDKLYLYYALVGVGPRVLYYVSIASLLLAYYEL